jgi:hypothetical protein
MSIRRILAAIATLIATLAIIGTTGAVAFASPEVHGITVQSAHAPQNREVKPDAHTWCVPGVSCPL